MKTPGPRRRNTSALPANSKETAGLSGAKPTSVNRAIKQRKKLKDKINIELSGISPGISAVVPGQSFAKYGKLKLQLFPIDRVTREILEKDAYNPHLELTLGMQKKISSVVKHLNAKWGNSKAASGELMLFPYIARLENLACHHRWTCKDTDTTAADVYDAIGSPNVFRLRYGWFANLEQQNYPLALSPIYFEVNVDAKENQIMITDEERPLVEGSNQENQPDVSLNKGADRHMALDTPVQVTNDDNVRKRNSASLSWIDSLSNVSMGALLSEASQNPDTSHCHQSSVHKSASIQQIPNFDSFDAAIEKYMSRQEATDASTQVPHSSIWDAEETCHAFSFQKATSFGKDIPSSSGDPCLTLCNRSSILNFTSHDIELLPQVLRKQDDAHREPVKKKSDGCLESITEEQSEPQNEIGEPKAEMQQQEELHNSGNCFGRMDSSLPECPLEFAPSSSSQNICGDTLSLSNLLASSLDAFQTFSIF